jgi:D-alanyl-D-alanine carboxypeptidase (penicillin-binding protein 5/6)
MKLLKLFLIYIGLLSSGNSFAVDIPNAPDLKSDSYVLLDFQTKKVLLSKNGDKILSPASITKIMTAYVVLKEIERGVISKEDNITISKKAVLTAKNTNSSRMFLEIGDVVPINDVIKGLIIHSGNDAAIALSEHIAGSEANFAKLMTSYAKDLGMINSQFKNASGLPAKNHYTTSDDLAILMHALIFEFPEEYKYYFSMKTFTYNDIKQNSRNKLLFKDDSFEGGKTGWHRVAQYCYIASVMKNGRRLVLVSLKAPNTKSRFEDAIALSNYGYRYFENHSLVLANKPLDGLGNLPLFKSEKSNVKISPKDSIILTLKRGQYKELKAIIDIKEKIIAPISKGSKIGVIKIFLKDKEIARTDLITNENVSEGKWWEVLVDDLALKFKD